MTRRPILWPGIRSDRIDPSPAARRRAGYEKPRASAARRSGTGTAPERSASVRTTGAVTATTRGRVVGRRSARPSSEARADADRTSPRRRSWATCGRPTPRRPRARSGDTPPSGGPKRDRRRAARIGSSHTSSFPTPAELAQPARAPQAVLAEVGAAALTLRRDQRELAHPLRAPAPRAGRRR